jgi:hypothetical protein
MVVLCADKEIGRKVLGSRRSWVQASSQERHSLEPSHRIL